MTKEEYKDRFTILSREDIYKALVEEGLAAEGEHLESLDLFLDYIRFPARRKGERATPACKKGERATPEEGTVAYYSNEVSDAKDWIHKWDDILIGWFEYEGNPDETLDGYLEDHGLSFRHGCTGTDELEDGQCFCEKVVDENGQMVILRYWARCASDTFVDLPAGELCSWLMLNNYVFDEYDWCFQLLECFMSVDEILQLVTED